MTQRNLLDAKTKMEQNPMNKKILDNKAQIASLEIRVYIFRGSSMSPNARMTRITSLGIHAEKPND